MEEKLQSTGFNRNRKNKRAGITLKGKKITGNRDNTADKAPPSRRPRDKLL